jgi:Fur family transcriptional regulator, peroxide stress response regulator
MTADEVRQFRDRCSGAGLAFTHQRQVLFSALIAMPGHPSPEQVSARVKRHIPSISLATVYKNIKLFIERGIFREVSLHHGSLRLETNSRPHHHLVCTQCKAICDIDEDELGQFPPPRKLSGGFLVERYAIDVLGLCAACQARDNG